MDWEEEEEEEEVVKEVTAQLLFMMSLVWCPRVVWEVLGLDSPGRRLPGMFPYSFLRSTVIHASVSAASGIFTLFLRGGVGLGS